MPGRLSTLAVQVSLFQIMAGGNWTRTATEFVMAGPRKIGRNSACDGVPEISNMPTPKRPSS